MFVSNGQFYVFVACLCFGGISGIIFSLGKLLKKIISVKFSKIIIDFVVFIISSILFVLYSYHLHFPNFRLYMIIGVFTGIYIYLKSFHIILAKIGKKAYNILANILKRKNKGNYDRRKV